MWQWGSVICLLTNSAGDSGACLSWKTTGAEDGCIYHALWWTFKACTIVPDHLALVFLWDWPGVGKVKSLHSKCTSGKCLCTLMT